MMLRLGFEKSICLENFKYKQGSEVNKNYNEKLCFLVFGVLRLGFDCLLYGDCLKLKLFFFRGYIRL